VFADNSLTLNANLNLPGLTASKVVFTDASKNLTSTGTVGVSQGGLGADVTAATAGEILYSSGATTYAHLAAVPLVSV